MTGKKKKKYCGSIDRGDDGGGSSSSSSSRSRSSSSSSSSSSSNSYLPMYNLDIKKMCRTVYFHLF